jgi:hypothetical protein
MRGARLALTGSLLSLLAFGCSSNTTPDKNSNNSQEISESEIPSEVQAAFFSEHPYAKIDHPLKQSDQNGAASYVLPYTLDGGAGGSATYSPNGVLVSGQ